MDVRDSDGHREARRRSLLARHGSTVFDSAREGMALTDAESRILAVNPAFCSITGYSPEEAVGQNPKILASGRHDGAFYAAMWDVLQRTGRWSGEIWNRRRSGQVYPEFLSITALRDAAGAIEGYFATFSDLSHLKDQESRLERVASEDLLTGLPNRRLFADRLTVAQARARRMECHLAIAVLDLDRFKHINDVHGHTIGDEVLVQVARRLRVHLRAEDTVARTAGDEFAMLLGDLEGAGALHAILDRLLVHLAEPLTIGPHTFQINASLGVMLVEPESGSSPLEADLVLREASNALYRAKQSGRNCYRFSDPSHNRTFLQQQAREARIAQALRDDEFVLHFQPKVFIEDGRVDGFEALIRWQHPEQGLVPPMRFLPDIQGTPLDIAVGEWVLREAFRQMEEWRSLGAPIALSVNLSADQLQHPGFEPLLHDLCAEFPSIDPRALELEVLESSLLMDLEGAVATIERCIDLGFRFTLDDFGTGYSSLTWLRKIPASRVKVDRSFVFEMLRDESDRAIVESVIHLAHTFGRQVIAEGVETIAHGEMLLRLGCDMAQGYGIARPMPAEEVIAWRAGWSLPGAWRVGEAVKGVEKESVSEP